jgi:hypothetical protein
MNIHYNWSSEVSGLVLNFFGLDSVPKALIQTDQGWTINGETRCIPLEDIVALPDPYWVSVYGNSYGDTEVVLMTRFEARARALGFIRTLSTWIEGHQ